MHVLECSLTTFLTGGNATQGTAEGCADGAEGIIGVSDRAELTYTRPDLLICRSKPLGILLSAHC